MQHFARRYILSALLLLAHITNVGAWGQKGHDIITYIAECHLTEVSRTRVERLLGGYSMVYWSSWADSAKYTKEYEYTSAWHYRNVEDKMTPAQTPTPKEGDVVYAIDEMIKRLKDPSLTPEEHSLALKLLIHLVGDLHCPMHAGREEDYSGGKIPMVFFFQATNLHAIWDTLLIEKTHSWSYTEWQREIDRTTDEEYLQRVQGNASTWFEESHEIAKEIYRDAQRQKEISYDYRDKYQHTLEKQLLNAGLRLANVLNEIYR